MTTESDNLLRSQRLLLTGASGKLGSMLRPRLRDWTDILRVSDIAPLGDAREGEELVTCNLAERDEVNAMVQGVEHIVHFGGISSDRPFDSILEANIVGLYNLYEAARAQGVRRVVYASSNHVSGFYPVGQMIRTDMPLRPDGLYGVSKGFGEMLSRYYYDLYGLETVCLRIGSAAPEPTSRRMLATWLSYDDLTELVRCALFAPEMGHTIVYGVSNNPAHWWSDENNARLGFVPRDSSEPWRPRIVAAEPGEFVQPYQGGASVFREIGRQ